MLKLTFALGIQMFTKFNLHERILKALTSLAFNTPTPVQEKAIPNALQGQDLFITAPTGTGKTAAFLLPLLHQLLVNGQPGTGLRALIILPTRELATQIQNELKKIARYTFLESLLVTGGEGLKEQAAKLRKNPDIVVGTPGRLLEQWQNKQLILDKVAFLVLDEADRMLDMGFGDDVNTLLDNCPSKKQTLLVSATQGSNILQELAKKRLQNPLLLYLNTDNKPNKNITQQIIFADNSSHKERLIEWLLAHENYEQAIIFTNTRDQANQLSATFSATQIKHATLHSDKTHQERKLAIAQLHQNHTKILIATDLAARGLDIKNIDLVINFDLPNTTDEYTHRIGRTGRMDSKGLAISLISPTDWTTLKRIQRDLKETLEPRNIVQLPSNFQGATNAPKNNSSNTEQVVKKSTTVKPKRSSKKDKTIAVTSTLVSHDGFAPLKRKK